MSKKFGDFAFKEINEMVKKKISEKFKFLPMEKKVSSLSIRSISNPAIKIVKTSSKSLPKIEEKESFLTNGSEEYKFEGSLKLKQREKNAKENSSASSMLLIPGS